MTPAGSRTGIADKHQLLRRTIGYEKLLAVHPCRWCAPAHARAGSRFPDADIALLYDFESIVCGDDALAVTRDDYYIKILTEAGRRQARTQSFHFNTTYNRLDIEILELIRPDGTRTTVNWDQPGAVMIDSGQMSSNIFDPAQRVRKATLPELEVGDIIHIRTRSTELKSRIPGVFSDLILLQSDWPVLKYLVEINLPEQLPLRSIAIKNPVPDSVKFSRREAGGRIIYRWEASDVPQLPAGITGSAGRATTPPVQSWPPRSGN